MWGKSPQADVTQAPTYKGEASNSDFGLGEELTPNASDSQGVTIQIRFKG